MTNLQNNSSFSVGLPNTFSDSSISSLMTGNLKTTSCFKYIVYGFIIIAILYLFVYPMMNQNDNNENFTSRTNLGGGDNVTLRPIIIGNTRMDGSDMSVDDISIEDEEIPLHVIAPNSYLLDTGGNSLMNNKCSKSCCSPQFPVSFPLDFEPGVCSDNKEYVPTNYTCNNSWNDVGCSCVTKDQINFLAHRGGNSD
jgi:hypothetical protein